MQILSDLRFLSQDFAMRMEPCDGRISHNECFQGVLAGLKYFALNVFVSTALVNFSQLVLEVVALLLLARMVEPVRACWPNLSFH